MIAFVFAHMIGRWAAAVPDDGAHVTYTWFDGVNPGMPSIEREELREMRRIDDLYASSHHRCYNDDSYTDVMLLTDPDHLTVTMLGERRTLEWVHPHAPSGYVAWFTRSRELLIVSLLDDFERNDVTRAIAAHAQWGLRDRLTPGKLRPRRPRFEIPAEIVHARSDPIVWP